MERCDFSSVIGVIRRYISDDHNLNQTDLLYEMFATFMNDENSQDFDFDSGLVCRWMNGLAKISPRISSYYMDKKHRKELENDIQLRILPRMYDSAMAVQEVYGILIQDSTISDKVKEEYTFNYPCKSEKDEAGFLAAVLCFGMKREFVKRDVRTKKLLASGCLSPVVSDFVMDGGVPRPCRYFRGRDQELKLLHEKLLEYGKVFLQGIPGIGKSELAKAYARLYSKEYTNILYLTYTGSLAQDISDMDFADDLPGDSEAERFRKHNRFLRTLKEDTLLIVDNFNATATQDSALCVIMKYRCRVLFTTRSRFENYASMELGEISDKQVLVSLAGCFYSGAQKNQNILIQIIDTVHSHTLAVELAARLLETGLLEPPVLLKKLKEEKASLDADDKICITKDGQSRKATYYDHIHTLFSLYQLAGNEQDLMRNMAFVPAAGISVRVFAKWLKLRDANTVNDLVEKGFIQARAGRTIALHPMIQEVTVMETRPSVQNCRALISGLQEICLRHGEEVPYYKQLFRTIENIVALIEKDEMEVYLRFLEDTFPYMQKYGYESGMELILAEMTSVLKEDSVGSVSDRALLLDFRAACEKKPEKEVKLERRALELIDEVTVENAHLAANIHANLGGYYKQTGRLNLAMQHMKTGISLLEQYDLIPYHDSVPQVINYAVLLTDMGEPQTGLSALQKLARVIREYHSDVSGDYAAVQEAMGNICLLIGDVQRATTHFKKAMSVYEILFDAEPELLEEKKREIVETYARAGIVADRKVFGR